MLIFKNHSQNVPLPTQKNTLWRNILASNSQNMAGMFLLYWVRITYVVERLSNNNLLILKIIRLSDTRLQWHFFCCPSTVTACSNPVQRKSSKRTKVVLYPMHTVLLSTFWQKCLRGHVSPRPPPDQFLMLDATREHWNRKPTSCSARSLGVNEKYGKREQTSRFLRKWHEITSAVCCGFWHMSSFGVDVAPSNAQTAPNLPTLKGNRWRQYRGVISAVWIRAIDSM